VEETIFSVHNAIAYRYIATCQAPNQPCPGDCPPDMADLADLAPRILGS
jgi:hypothetical protein